MPQPRCAGTQGRFGIYPSKRAAALGPDQGRIIAAFGNKITYKVTGDDTAGGFAVVEFEVRHPTILLDGGAARRVCFNCR